MTAEQATAPQMKPANRTKEQRDAAVGHVCDTPAPTILRLWGLTPLQIHDAYWRSQGIECVRIGQAAPFDRTADAYLLLEPNQAVLFDLKQVLHQLIWQGPAILRLRLVNINGSSYDERIVLDERGSVERIERLYGPSKTNSQRVFISTRRAMAAQWQSASSSRDAWSHLRRRVNWSHIARHRTAGRWFATDEVHTSRQLLLELVERWDDPGRVIASIVQASRGVWMHQQHPGKHMLETTVIGPVWIGMGAAMPHAQCIIGPRFLEDAPSLAAQRTTSVRQVHEIIQGEPASRPLIQPSAKPMYETAKRAFDVLFSSLLLVILSPLLAAIALAIIIDSGTPVLFRHRRQTRGGVTFECLKFRTMRVGSERLAASLLADNICDGPQVCIRDDPRTTRIGRILRRLQLDELPQFWNVLRGEMSVVGPRPSPERENQICPAWRELRLSVRPGVTGLWQLHRTRNDGEDFQEWIRYDIAYVRNASFWLDLSICARTALLMVFRRDRQ